MLSISSSSALVLMARGDCYRIRCRCRSTWLLLSSSTNRSWLSIMTTILTNNNQVSYYHNRAATAKLNVPVTSVFYYSRKNRSSPRVVMRFRSDSFSSIASATSNAISNRENSDTNHNPKQYHPLDTATIDESSSSAAEPSFYEDFAIATRLLSQTTAYTEADYMTIRTLLSHLETLRRTSTEYPDHLLACWEILIRCWNQVEELAKEEDGTLVARFMQQPSHAWLFTQAKLYTQSFVQAPQPGQEQLPMEMVFNEILSHRFWILSNADWEYLLKQAVLQNRDVETMWNALLEYADREDFSYFPTIGMFQTMMMHWTKKQNIDNDIMSSFQAAEAKMIPLWKLFRQKHSVSILPSTTPYKILWNFYRTGPENRSIDDADFLNELQSKYSISWDDQQVVETIAEVLLPPLTENNNKSADIVQDDEKRQQAQQIWLQFLQYITTHTENNSLLTHRFHCDLLESFQQESQHHDVPKIAKHMDDLLVQIFRRLDTPGGWYEQREFLVWQFYRNLTVHQKKTTIQILQDLQQNKHITIATWNAVLADILLRIERRSCHPEEEICKQVFDVLQFLESNESSIQPNVATYGWGLQCFVAMSSSLPDSSSTPTNSSVLSPHKLTFVFLDRIETCFGWSQDDLRETYNRLIFTALNHDLEFASALLDRMASSAANPDGSTWTVLLKHWGRREFGRSGAERAERILWHLRELAMNAPEKYGPMGADCYAAAIHAWRRLMDPGKNDDVPERMIKIYQTFLNCEDGHLLPDGEASTIINSAIHNTASRRLNHKTAEHGERLIDLIARRCNNVRPDGRLYRLVTYGWLNTKDAERALKSMERYIDAYCNSDDKYVPGRSPDRIIVASVLLCLIERGRFLEATNLVEKIQNIMEQNEMNPSFDLDLLDPGVVKRILVEWISKTGYPNRNEQISRVLGILDSMRRLYLTKKDQRQAISNLTKTEPIDSTVSATPNADQYSSGIAEHVDNFAERFKIDGTSISDDLDRTVVEEQTDGLKTTDVSEKDSTMAISDQAVEGIMMDDDQSDVSTSSNTTFMPPTTASDDHGEEIALDNTRQNVDVDETMRGTKDEGVFDESLFLAPKTPVARNPITKLYPRPRGRRPARAEAWDEQVGLWRLSTAKTTTSAA